MNPTERDSRQGKPAVFTQDTFSRGKLTFLLYCVTFSIVK